MYTELFVGRRDGGFAKGSSVKHDCDNNSELAVNILCLRLYKATCMLPTGEAAEQIYHMHLSCSVSVCFDVKGSLINLETSTHAGSKACMGALTPAQTLCLQLRV